MVMNHRNALRKLWDGLCDVFILEEYIDTTTGRNATRELQELTGEPCRLSFSTVPVTTEQDGAAKVQQLTKLFVSNEVDIPPGSKVVVTQKGVTRAYKRSGLAAVYSDHQEIPLELFEGWA